MKINIMAESKSPRPMQLIVVNLVKEFCEDNKIPFNTSIFHHLTADAGVAHLNKWTKERGLPFTYTKIADKSATYAVIFDFEENENLTNLLLTVT